MRRRILMPDQAISDAKYPLVNGRHDFSDGSYVEVTNGNHVKAIKNGHSMGYFNASNINQNTDEVYTANNTDRLPTWITIPNNSTCLLKIFNIKRSGNHANISINLRKAESSSSIGFSTINFFDTDDKESEIIITNNTNVSCVILWFSYEETYAEFDIELYVNGERWI